MLHANGVWLWLPTEPIAWVPLPVSLARLQPVPRPSLGLPGGCFLFLFVFDFNSYLARNNPLAVIAAFQRAFPVGDGSVDLVLKTMNGRADNDAWRQFVAVCAADPRITLLDRTLDREVVLGLVDACDAFVSLHRVEGFGRTLVEAMLLGKPVVVTDFSWQHRLFDKGHRLPGEVDAPRGGPMRVRIHRARRPSLVGRPRHPRRRPPAARSPHRSRQPMGLATAAASSRTVFARSHRRANAHAAAAAV